MSSLEPYACKEIHGKVSYLFYDESDVTENTAGGMSDVEFKKLYWLEDSLVKYSTFALKTAKTPEKDHTEINLKINRRSAE